MSPPRETLDAADNNVLDGSILEEFIAEMEGVADRDDADDIDYVPAHDAFDTETDESGVDFELEIPGSFPGDGSTSDESQSANDQTQRTQNQTSQLWISREQLVQLLHHSNGQQISWIQQFLRNQEEDEDGAGSDTSIESRRRTRRRRPPAPREPVPNENGTKLMASGTFGTNERPQDSMRRKKMVAMRLLRRELGVGNPGREQANCRLLRQDFIPSSNADMIINYNARCYSGQFSKDGNFFFSCAQDFKVRMYDTSNPYDWKYYKTINVPTGQWTITDATLSPDNRFLAASSIQNVVTLASTDPTSVGDNTTELRHLDFARLSPGTNTGPRGRARGWGGYGHFGIWSLRFSGDGKEIVAGTGDHSVYVYDLERQQSILRIPGHSQDVNAVCYGDEMSPHILFSGSDDCTLKVWDRRSMGDGRAAGVFVGHVEGLTYVDAKGDGRYVLSNGKDQTMKLWDLRKVVMTEDADTMHFSNNMFDYRSDSYPEGQWRPHPDDCSLVTFRGHAVLQTLIRCHFSPPNSSDGRYVYSGSQEGKVWIWNLDGTVKKTIDVFKATKGSRPYDASSTRYSYWDTSRRGWKTVVRDASWHPDVGMIAATSWNGYSCGWGTCTVHSWRDEADEQQEQHPASKMVDSTLVDWQAVGASEHRARTSGRPVLFDDSDDDTDIM